ncbi:beta/alpha barrel domain-containing protein [Streptomyces griseorubiginosus]|uniref:hypothetical protein n=1 Tax=Streptomyces griseorubiginosus TaxID=67304 RepID=UPI0036EFB6D7
MSAWASGSDRAFAHTLHGSGTVQALSSEGVSLWLDGLSRRHLLDGTLRAWVRSGLVRGAFLSLSAMTAELRRREGTSYQHLVDALTRGGATPEHIARALVRADAHRACRMLAPVHAAAGGLDGWVCTDFGETSVTQALDLAAGVGRRNLLIGVAATRNGLDVLRLCAQEGVGTSVLRIRSEERFAEVLGAHWSGLEAAVGEGRDPARSPCVPCVEVGDMDAAVDDVLARAVPGNAQPRPAGRAGLALARAVYGYLDRQFDSDRWRALRSAGALPCRIAWSGSTPTHVADIVGWRTAHVVTPDAAVETALGPAPLGDSLTGRAPDALRVHASLRRQGVHLGCLAETLTRREQRARTRERAAFLQAVRERMPRS